MNNSIYVLHLSDLHIDPNQEGETKPVFENLCKKLRDFRQEKEKDFDLLIISGDLVNKGAGDYNVAMARIMDILSACGLSKDQVFMVPGNHDVERSKCTGMYHYILKVLKSTPAEFECLDDTAKNVFWPGFAEYQKFSQQFPLMQQKNFDLPGFALAELNISDIPVRLCGLNSAIIAGPYDDGKSMDQLRDRIIGKKILWQMLSGKDRLNLVVSHYPLSWVNPIEGREVIDRLQQAGSIYFNGHIHESDSSVSGLLNDTQLLVLGVGSLYGQKWIGQNHCHILELNPNLPSPVLHEYLWFSKLGWRRLEPLEVAWPKWGNWRKLSKTSSTHDVSKTKTLNESGLVNIGNYRENDQRAAYYQKALQNAAEGSELMVVGRSLIDFSLLSKSIETAIKQKKLRVKIGLLDENTLFNEKDTQESSTWIEKPNPKDWAIRDVPTAMKHLRQIEVSPNTGSLEIYGLPFYTSHSLISYIDKHDNQRYCLEELGMALEQNQRPFVEFKVVSDTCFGSALERLYREIMTPSRMLLCDDGQRIEKDTTQRAKILVNKVERMGLVDLSVGRDSIDWITCAKDVQDIIQQTPKGGEIFIVGRSLVSWADHKSYEKLAEAIVYKGINCIFVLADVRINDLQSLVKGDYASKDLGRVWQTFQEPMVEYIDELMKKNGYKREQIGTFELYGIPAYLPETFAIYTRQNGVRYCSMEIGIGVSPKERTILYFQNVSQDDIFTSLERIYKSIISHREPALRIPCDQQV